MFALCDLFSETQQKLENSCECGTFRKRCMTREITAIAIILNVKVNEFPKGIGFASNFAIFLGENKNVIDFLIDFYVFYSSDIETFLRIKFNYKLRCTLRLQLHSISFYWM